MRFLQLLPTIVAALAPTTIPARAGPTPSAPPQFETLFFGNLELGTIDTLNTTFGTRVNFPVKGLNLTDTSGNLIATLLSPTADTGVVSNSGIFFPEAHVFLRWEADQKLAYFTLNGVGDGLDTHGDAPIYSHLETDSEIYSSLNGRFIVANVSSTEGLSGNLTITFFGAV
ncbi:hypothetical protein C8T65DRAFT_593838 [Cerioporus squamosus]|nr:hypothetical protein C8T65DRAFT_593838 [Cerioporus squamosus]